MIGEAIAHYQITAKLGEGGMGEVYRAIDTKLGRDVAIKVLPDAFANDPDRLQRFQREAQVLASLNHPNIAQIYGLEESDKTRCIVMELVEGQTLQERLKRGPIPLDEALPIAKQIAEALEAAHEKGIVHRDLKPANIKLTPDGAIKVLDFGLARISETSSDPTNLSNSPTLMSAASIPGMIMGTAAYMSPEQARGKAVDKRADVWAFGVVLFEMLTGRRLFQGEDASETLAAVIKEEPPWKLVPAQVRRLLQGCLEKDPTRRLRDIGDAWRLVEDTPQSMHSPRQLWLSWGPAAVFAVVAALAFWAPWRTAPPAPEPKRFQILVPDKTSVGRFAVSPDGRWLAFAGTGADGVRRLWVRAMDSLEVRPLHGTEGAQPSPPFWSPDSRFLAFDATRILKKIDISGGPPQSICDLSPQALGGSWNQDGVIIFGTNGPLMRVLASGGVPSAITALDDSRKENRHLLPVFLPDGRHFLYVRISNTLENSGIYSGSLDSAPAQQNSKLIVATNVGSAYVSSSDPRRGQLLFLRDQILMRQTLDVQRLELTGEPSSLAEQVGSFLNAGFFSASLNGVLVYRTGLPGGQSTQLDWLDAQGKLLGTAWEPDIYLNVALAPDGRRAAVSRRGPQGGYDIWIVDFLRGTNSRFTFGSGTVAINPVWSPDGSRIVFGSNRDGVYNLYQKLASGAKDEEILLKSGQGKYPTSWSHDGRFLLYTTTSDSKRKNDLWVLPLEGDRKPIPLLATEFDENDGQFSPDGHFVAYVSDESGRPEIYVRGFSGTSAGGKWLVSKSGGSSPRWRRDGGALFYLAADGTVMQAEVNTSAAFQVGMLKELFKLAPGATTLDVTGEGKRFHVGVPVEQQAQTPFTVALNWYGGLAARENR
jgi:Tol biopolymer transport system component